MALFVGLLCLLIVPAACQAAESYRSSGIFAPENPPSPERIAVDGTSGDVLVLSYYGFVSVYAPGGAGGAPIAEFGGGELSSPYGIAVDQSNGDVYVSNSTGIFRYTSDGADPPTYTRDGSYLGPTEGAEPGQVGSFAAPLAVDPTNGDLLVGDNGNRQISRYTSAGTFVSSFTGEDSAAGRFHRIMDIAVDSGGGTYVLDNVEGEVEWGGTVAAERFAPDGSADGSLPVNSPRALTFDPHWGNVIVAGDSTVEVTGPLTTRPRLYVFHGGQPVFTIRLPEEADGSTVLGLGVDVGTGRLYALTVMTLGFLGQQGVRIFDPIVLPDLTVGATTAITATSAHFSGSVDPLGITTHYHFEYSSDGTNWAGTPAEEAGESPEAVSADVEGLAPNTEYSVRLSAVNAEGETATESSSFTTLGAPPEVTTGAASGRTETNATLNGSVNPLGEQTTYHFEYGPTLAYGQLGPAFEATAGKGRAPLAVSFFASDLQPGVTYHYRLVAKSGSGRGEGEDRTFTTPSGLPHRAYEMVSPVEKGGESVRSIPIPESGFQARSDGDSIVYTTNNSAFPDAESSPFKPRQIARRGPSGWSSEAIDPQIFTPEVSSVLFSTLAVSEDQSHSLVVTRRKLTPGAVEGKANLYMKDLSNGTYTFIATNLLKIDGAGGQYAFLGGTPTFSSVAFVSTQLTAAEPDGTYAYEWTSGRGLSVASVLPDGSPLAGAANTTARMQAKHQMSADGHRLYFVIGVFPPGNAGLYLNEGGNSRPVSVSHVPGDPQETHSAIFEGATEDGRYAIFTSLDDTPLTSDAPAGPRNLYQYDAETEQLEYLAPSVRDVIGVSDDLSYVYYISAESIDPSPPGPGPYLYLEHAGQSKLLSEVRSPDVTFDSAEASPSGRYLAIQTRANLTSFDSSAGGACANEGACKEIYLYDAASDELSCASCRTDGGTATGLASMSREQNSFLSRHFPTAVTDAGQVFFDTPDPLVSADVNGTRDVYEYAGGQARLISGGKTATVSAFIDATPDGRNIFFVTDDRLVGQDTDSANDLYDARVDGGFASQDGGRQPGECTGEGCRGSSPAPPTAASIGSESTSSGSGKRPVARKHRRCSKSGKGKAAKRCLGRHQKHTNRRKGR